MKIKICGITSEREVKFLNDIKPDYIGFVFAESKRIVSKEQGKLLYDLVDKEITVVGVFRDNSLSYIREVLKLIPLDVVQLHGEEDEEFINKLRKEFKGKIWKAISVKSKDDIKKITKFKVDLLMLDGGNPGSGQIFPWKYLDNIVNEKDFLLAGGISEKNVLEAIEEVMPYGIDVSSGVETIVEGKRMKDELKVQRLINKVREKYER